MGLLLIHLCFTKYPPASMTVIWILMNPMPMDIPKNPMILRRDLCHLTVVIGRALLEILLRCAGVGVSHRHIKIRRV
jgi:hypothetical protein